MGLMTTMRKRMHIVLWGLLFMFLLSMTIGGLVGGADIVGHLLGRVNPATTIARINDRDISPELYQNLVNQEIEKIRSSGQEIKEFHFQRARSTAWDNLLQDVLVSQEVDKLGLTASDEEVLFHLENEPPVFLQQNPSFQTDGVFDKETIHTLYGAYKFCNEETAKVYMQDWDVPSTCLRPGVVYGVGRDQGMTSKTTVAILAAALGKNYTIPFTGPVSWLHAGEVASAFIKSVSKPREAAKVFDINGTSSTVESSIQLIHSISNSIQITSAGSPLPFPMSLSDAPIRSYLGDYGSVELSAGIEATFSSFKRLIEMNLLSESSLD